MIPDDQAGGFAQGVLEKLARVVEGKASDDERDYVRGLAKALESAPSSARVEEAGKASGKRAPVASIRISPVTFITAFGIFLAFVSALFIFYFNGLRDDIKGLDSKIDARLAGMESKMETRLAGMETRLSGMESKMETRLAGLETRIAGLETKLESKIEALTVLVTDLRVEFAKHMGSSSSPEISGAGPDEVPAPGRSR
jgi:uncharacterized coiled-coil protein SlyX